MNSTNFPWRWLAVMLALVGAAATAATEEGDATRGRDIYEGRIALSARTTGGAEVPSKLSACVQCHRPSGLGSFEGRVAIAPITGRFLFKEMNPDTAKLFSWSGTQRIRPAYSAGSLGSALRTGVAPDGQVMRAPMPLYKISDADVRDLTTYLRGLSAGPTPGIDENTVRIATITTPGVDPVRAEAMLTVFKKFQLSRNGQTRHEAQRSAQVSRNRVQLFNSKFRLWNLVHWKLEGPPDTWPAQLQRYYDAEPVFGVLSGMGAGDWSPVDRFCERMQLPCILPQVEQVPDLAAGQERFYSVYFHPGLTQDVAVALQGLRRSGIQAVELWIEDARDEERQLALRLIKDTGLIRVEQASGTTAAVVSLLPPEAHLSRWATREGKPAAVAWAPGARWLSEQQWQQGIEGAATAWVVSPLKPKGEGASGTRRAEAWLKKQALQELPLDVASTSLYAATVFSDAFAHLDFDHTREYMLELLEHGLENMISISPYPRLAIGPSQRIASKGSYLGTLNGGEVSWQWQALAKP
jgi:mono/diheme cytochrome c family protein